MPTLPNVKTWRTTDLVEDAGGATPSQIIKTSAGTVFGLEAIPTGADFIKLYDMATDPNPASDVPKITIGTANGVEIHRSWSFGIKFATGIAIRGTTAVADSNAADPAGATLNTTVLYV
jgi:hypothetical protein